MLSLSRSFTGIKEANLLLPSSTSKELVEDPLKAMERSQRWKLSTAYGDAGLRYQEDQAIAYVASRMPAVYSALFRVLSEVKKQVSVAMVCVFLSFDLVPGACLCLLGICNLLFRICILLFSCELCGFLPESHTSLLSFSEMF